MSRTASYTHNRLLGCSQENIGLSREANWGFENAGEIFAHYFTPASRKSEFDIFDEFCDLAAKWKKETRFLSSLTDICMNKSYQQIIAMGRDVLPLIFFDLKKEPYHWFWALTVITGEDPIPPQHRGKMPEMRDAWLEWAKKHSLIL